MASAAILAIGLAAAPASDALAKNDKSAPQSFKLTTIQSNDLHGHLAEICTLLDGRVQENNVAKYATGHPSRWPR